MTPLAGHASSTCRTRTTRRRETQKTEPQGGLTIAKKKKTISLTGNVTLSTVRGRLEPDQVLEQYFDDDTELEDVKGEAVKPEEGCPRRARSSLFR